MRLSLPLLCWDTSGLVKRYATEPGSDTVNSLFEDNLPFEGMAGVLLGYVETYSVLLRRHNAGQISRNALATAVHALQAEVLDGDDFLLLEADSFSVLSSMRLVRAHNLNSSDAIILTLFLRLQAAQPSGAPCIVVASDHRLLRAASAEGLQVLNPETLAPGDIPAFLQTL